MLGGSLQIAAIDTLAPTPLSSSSCSVQAMGDTLSYLRLLGEFVLLDC